VITSRTTAREVVVAIVEVSASAKGSAIGRSSKPPVDVIGDVTCGTVFAAAWVFVTIEPGGDHGDADLVAHLVVGLTAPKMMLASG